eukprot:g1704.t1
MRKTWLPQDVYFVKPELPSELASAERKEEVIGERVEFEVLVKPDGKIRAQDMRLLGSAGKDEPESDLDDDLVQEMEDFLVEHGNRQNYGNFTNRFPRVKKTKIQKHFHITDGDGRQFVELPPDHPRRIEEAAQRPEDEDMREEPKEEPKEEPREDARENEDYLDDFPEPLEEAREVNEEDVDPNEPAIPLGKGLHPLGVIRDYDAKKGYGFIRCKGLAEEPSWVSVSVGKERVRALERQTEAAQAQQKVNALSAALRKAEVLEESWEKGVSSLLQQAKEQRAELVKVVDLLKAPLKESGLSGLSESGDLSSLPELVKKALGQMDSKKKEKVKEKSKSEKEQSEKEEEEEEKEESEKEEKEKDKKKKGKKKEEKEEKEEKNEKKGSRKEAKEGKDRKKRRRSRKERGSDASDSYSYSRTPSPRRRRKRRRRRRRRPSPSYSRSYSYTPSKERRKGTRRKGTKRRSGGRDRGGASALDVGSEISRFVKVNKLEERCEKILRDLDAKLAFQGVQVSFEYNPSGGRGPRSDSVQLLLRWLATDRCWLLKRAQIPPKETKP